MIKRAEHIALRAPQMGDAAIITLWENSRQAVTVSDHEGGFTVQDIRADILEAEQHDDQERWLITLHTGRPIGTLHLYDIDLLQGQAYIGILLGDSAMRGKGHAREALQLAHQHAEQDLGLDALIAEVHSDNSRSLAFFKAMGYTLLAEREGLINLIYRTKETT